MGYLVGENFFQDNEIKSFCTAAGDNSTKPSVDLNELKDFFSAVLGLFEEDPTDGVPLVDRLQEDWDIFSSREKGVEILSNVHAWGGSLPAPEAPVKYKEDVACVCAPWKTLKDDLRNKKRFLIDITDLLDHSWDKLLGMSQPLDPTMTYYRARIHGECQEDPYSCDQMGAPPREKCTSGRANVIGIPCLYLCDDEETTLYEVRAIYQDEASIGQFRQENSSENILIADFANTQSLYYWYTNYPDNWTDVVKQRLLTKLISRDLSRPKRRYDTEIEYIPTQFICEFVREISGVQGVRFESSLHPGHTNLVLFYPELMRCVDVRAKRVEEVIINAK